MIINEDECYPIAPFSGERQVLIVGAGTVEFYRSLDKGANYWNLTDEAGEFIEYSGIDEDAAILNSTITNSCQSARFIIKCTEGSVSIEVIAND